MAAEAPVPAQSEGSETSQRMTVAELTARIANFDDEAQGIRFYPRNGVYAPLPFRQLLEYADGSPEMVVTVDSTDTFVDASPVKAQTSNFPSLLVALPDTEAQLISGTDLGQLSPDSLTIAYSEKEGDFSFEHVDPQVSSLVRRAQFFHSWRTMAETTFVRHDNRYRPRSGIKEKSVEAVIQDIYYVHSETKRKRIIKDMRKIFGPQFDLYWNSIVHSGKKRSQNFSPNQIEARQTILTTMAIISDTPYSQESHGSALASKHTLRRVPYHLRQQALFLLSDLVASDMDRGRFRYRALDRRYTELYRQYADGRPVEAMMQQLGLGPESAEGFRKLFYQLALGLSGRRFDFATSRKALTPEEVLTQIDSFCSQINIYRKVEKRPKHAATRLSDSSSFANSWQEMGWEEKRAAVDLYVAGDFASLSALIGCRESLVHEFFRCLDFFALDNASAEEIFEPTHPGYRRRTLGGFRNVEDLVDEFSKTLFTIYDTSFLEHILPKEAQGTQNFMNIFLATLNEIGTTRIIASKGISQEIIGILANAMGYSVSTIGRVFVRASILCDYVTRLKLETENARWDSPIVRAFTLMSLADYIDVQAKGRK